MNEKNKYPGERTVHWLAMYHAYHDEWTKGNIEQEIELYKGIEGVDAFRELQTEMELIIHNNDLPNFLRDARKGEVKLSDLQFMCDTILSSQ